MGGAPAASHSSAAVAVVAASAFVNKLVGLTSHAFALPQLYSGDAKLAVDAVAVVCAGTLASMLSMRTQSSLGAALVDSAIPICLAFVAPGVLMPSVVHAFRATESRLLPLVAGMCFVAFLGSTERVLVELASRMTHTARNDALVVATLVALLAALVGVRRVLGEPAAAAGAAAAGRPPARVARAVATLVALFAVVLAYQLVPARAHRALAPLAALAFAGLCARTAIGCALRRRPCAPRVRRTRGPQSARAGGGRCERHVAVGAQEAEHRARGRDVVAAVHEELDRPERPVHLEGGAEHELHDAARLGEHEDARVEEAGQDAHVGVQDRLQVAQLAEGQRLDGLEVEHGSGSARACAGWRAGRR